MQHLFIFSGRKNPYKAFQFQFVYTVVCYTRLLYSMNVHAVSFYVYSTDEAPSAQPHPQAYPQSSEPYTNQLPPSYDVQYTANAPDPQAIQVSFCTT